MSEKTSEQPTGERPTGERPDDNLDAASAADADNAPDGDAPTDGAFDALGAAAELDAILNADDSSEPVEQVGESYTDILESELASMTALADEREVKLKAAEDELEKARVRIETAAERKLEQRSRKILCGFLEVLDDLDRALAAARSADHNPAVIDGIELVRKSFMQKLASFGVTHDPSMGEVFDPNLHDAMSVMTVTDPDQDGKVVAVIREGYYIGDDTLRPAGVVVGKKSS